LLGVPGAHRDERAGGAVQRLVEAVEAGQATGGRRDLAVQGGELIVRGRAVAGGTGETSRTGGLGAGTGAPAWVSDRPGTPLARVRPARGTPSAAPFPGEYAPGVRRMPLMATTMTMWTPTTHADYDLLKGKDVHSAGGEEVGTITRVFHPAGD